MSTRVVLLGAIVPVVLFVWVLAATVASGSRSTSSADSECVSAVMTDWAQDGRIDRTYSASCYEAAIDALPEDLRAYSSAEEDLRRALQSSGRRTH